jgi:hypothetical protein
MTTIINDPYRHIKIPVNPTHQFIALICGRRFTGTARIPECPDGLRLGMLAVFRWFLESVGGGYTITQVERDHRFVWKQLTPITEVTHAN